MICSKCGNENNNDSVFCNKCGTKFQTNFSEKHHNNERSEEKNSRKVVYKGELHKCPNCSENLKSYDAICPTCGYEIRSSKSSNTLENFIRELKALDDKKVIKGKGKQLVESIGFGSAIDVDKQKINLIKNYIVPNITEDLFEFLIYASSNIDVEIALEDYSNFDLASEKEINSIKAINDAWMEKAKHVYHKLNISSKNHPKFEGVESIYLEKINAIKNFKVNETNKKKRNRKSFIISIVIIAIAAVILVPFIIKITDPKLLVPVSSIEYIGRDYKEVILELEDIGFTNLVINEIEMSPTDTTKIHGSIVQISFQGVPSFEAETEFRSRTKIEITYYVIKHTINVRVEFEPNLLFNKYDVKMLVNGDNKGTIMHGKKTDFTFRFRAGENTITFAKIDDSKVKGSIKIMVDGDLDVVFKITALKDEVTIENITSQIDTFFPVQINIICEKKQLFTFIIGG